MSSGTNDQGQTTSSANKADPTFAQEQSVPFETLTLEPSAFNNLSMMKKPTSIEDLPNEILEQLLSLTTTQAHARWPINHEYPALKTARLVCSGFNQVASRLLFQTVILYEHSERYNALNSIANSAHLAPLVKHVQLANLGYLPDCDNGERRDAEDEAEHDCRTSGVCGTYEFYLKRKYSSSVGLKMLDYPPAGGPLAALNFSPRECYNRYVRWRNGEYEMRQHVKNGTAPHLDLHLLSSLRSVETVGLHEMRVVHRIPRVTKKGYVRTQRPGTRRFFETGLMENNAMTRNKKITWCHLRTFLIAATVSGKNLTSLIVRRFDDILRSQEYNNDNPSLQLRSLRTLKIDLSQIWYSYEMDDPSQLAPWVHDLANLEELCIYQNPGNFRGEADVVQLFSHLSLPNLNKLKLRHVNVHAGVIKSFLMQHNDTLRTMEIVEPCMDQEEWDELHQLYRPGSSLAKDKNIHFVVE